MTLCSHQELGHFLSDGPRNLILWTGIPNLIALLGLLLAIDLFWLNRGSHTVSASKALRQTAGWVALALAFNAVIFVLYDSHAFGLGAHTFAISPHGAGPIVSGIPDDTPPPNPLMPTSGKSNIIS